MTEFWSNHFDTGISTGIGGFVGFYSSLRFDPGTNNPAIASWDATRNRPRYTLWDGRAWIEQDIDPQRGSGRYVSMAYDDNQLPVASYWNTNTGGLRLSRSNGATWTPEMVDDTSLYTIFSSLEIDGSGTERIAYAAFDTDDPFLSELRMATWNGATWSLEVVDAQAGTGWYASLELDPSDAPGIAYYDAVNQQLKYAHWNGASWDLAVVAGPGAGEWAALAYDSSGNPAIAYYDATNTSLMYAFDGGSGWTIETVDTGDVGTHATLRFDAADNPSIGYHDALNYDLKFARHDGAVWNLEIVVDTPNITGEWASLGFNAADQPAISYYNGSRFSLRYAEFAGTAWSIRDVLSYGNSLWLYVAWEDFESQAFRDNALGNFRDLLDVSAKSAVMMLFLNNDENTAANGNENYARELLELHTVGVDGGYTQLDVETMARAITGWTHSERSPRCDPVPVADPYFCYNHRAHDGTAKTIMGTNFVDDAVNDPSNWMKQGDEILDWLTVHPETAKFLCGKLIEKFVSDVALATLQGECEATWLRSRGDIRKVLETLLLSDEFLDGSNFLNKVRTPFEYVAAATRNLAGDTDGWGLWASAAGMGMPLFRQDVPTGWPEEGLQWVSSNSFLQRWKFADAFAHNSIRNSSIDPWGMVTARGLTTADGVLSFFGQRLLRGQMTTSEEVLLRDCLTGGDPSWTTASSGAADQIRDMVGVMLGFPIYEKQ